MKRNKLNVIVLSLILISTPVLQGCFALLVGGAVGAAGYAYFKGGLRGEFETTVDEANKASVAALEDLGYFVTSDELNTASSVVIAEDDQDTIVRVEIEKITEYKVSIYVRSGIIGNEEISFAVLEAIAGKL